MDTDRTRKQLHRMDAVARDGLAALKRSVRDHSAYARARHGRPERICRRSVISTTDVEEPKSTLLDEARCAEIILATKSFAGYDNFFSWDGHIPCVDILLRSTSTDYLKVAIG